MDDKLLDSSELAKYLGVAESTIKKYRLEGVGPAYVKIGHLVRYRIADVDEWVERKMKSQNPYQVKHFK
jgi:excisionase family DNA binding protein